MMTSTHRLRTVTCHAFVFASLVILAMHSAEAQTKPFKITGEGVAPTGLPLPGQEARPHWIRGTATHLGRHYGAGSAMVKSVDDSGLPQFVTGKFGSGQPFVFVAANGDKLVCDYGRDANGELVGDFKLTIVGVTGEGQPVVTAFFVAEFVVRPDQSTGRFAGVTGSWTMYAYSAPFVPGAFDPFEYRWEGQGKLNFPRGARGRGSNK